MIEACKLVFMTRLRGMCATKDKPDTIDVCSNSEQSKRNLGHEHRARVDGVKHRRAGRENRNERRYFHEEVYPLMERDQNELLGAALAEQGSLEERFGDDSPEPDTNEGKMDGKQVGFHWPIS